MTWVRIDDKAWSHPKFATLSGNAARLWLFGLCWCNQQESDGLLPSSMLRMLRGTPKDAAELVAAGLWEAVEGGWQYHDFLEYQPSRQQLAEQRNKTRERVTKHRERSRNDVTERECNSVTQESVTPLVTPPPSRPGPTRTEHPSGVEREADKPPSPPRPRVVRWRRVPANWEPNDSHREMASELCVDFDRELASFRDHEFKDPKTDADATFRTWLRRAEKYRPAQPQQRVASGGGSSLPLLMARIQRMEADGEGN